MKTQLIQIGSLLVVACCMFLACGDDGDPGPQGPQGEQGLQGTPGAQGEQGPQGDQGEPGAQGEQGEQGTQGAQGDKGDKGDKGETGTANVIYSDWIESPFGPPEAQSKFFNLAEGAPFDLNTDVVLVYGRFDSGVPIVSILPFLEVDEAEYYHFTTIVINNVIRVLAKSTDGVNSFFDEFAEYRYVIIPGGVSVSGGRIKPPVDYNDYQAVKAYYNIAD